ncbi:MAG: MOSC domain-containing protein [Planctomycetaceae bacterium]|nr:MOSC domain-containing protein [Planctomycetaceae bacterium]
MQGTVIAICRSEARGTPKHEVATARLVRNHGIDGDAHAGDWHRQVSLLSYDKVRRFNEAGGDVGHGDFGENIIIENIDLATLPVGTKLRIGDALLEVTQIGKECHQHCQIFHRVGDCIMPREGIFARVLEEGEIAAGARVDVLQVDRYRVAIITASDKGSRGERVDESGPALQRMVEDAGYQVVRREIVPDDHLILAETMRNLCDNGEADLILTTGGTGFSPRDCTPEATLDIAERLAPGLAEAMRLRSLEKTDRAMLSRGVAVIRGATLIINLPGSPRGATENLAVVMPVLGHALDILTGRDGECAAPVRAEL